MIRTIRWDWKAGLAAVVVGLCGALATAVVNPLFLIAGLVGVTVLVSPFLFGYRVFWTYLMFLLLGYLLLGKGFAYVGVAPVYVAEAGLALALLTSLVVLLVNGFRPASPLLRPEVLFLCVFMAWEAACTIPYIGTYGIDALRDAALWSYGAFTLLILLLVPRQAVDRIFALYAKVLPWYLIYLPVAWVFVKLSPINFSFPGSPVPLLYLKSGDVGVHLAGAAAFMLLRLDTRADKRGVGWSNTTLWLLWCVWIVDWAAWGASNRSGMLSALVGIGVVFLWRPRTRWYRPVVVGIALFVSLLVTNLSSPSFGSNNDVSSGQIVANVTSIFGGGSSHVLDATRAWRLDWWNEILHYTFGGQYFWTGKGYGINLANVDGFQVKQDDSVRDPHNVSMDVLARSGVPGLGLWLVFLASFGFMLASRASAKSPVGLWEKRYALWLLAYWLAFLFNGSFDVFIEGPMGGVWFWSIIGISLVYFAGGSQTSKSEAGPAPSTTGTAV